MTQPNLKQALQHDTDNKQLANAPARNGGQLNDFLIKHKGQFAAALPKHLNPDRMVRLALTAFNSSKQLQGCSMNSIAASIVMASQLGLEIGVAGQGYLVPYKGQCQFIPGWQGYVDLVSRSGRATVWTGAVYEGDEFDYALGDSPFIKHRPGGEDDPAKLVCVYSVGRVNGSEWPVIEVWPIARVRKHFNKNNKVGNMHYAHNNWEMYARKIPLLQVIKYMPKSIELSNALTAETAYETGHTYTIDGDTVIIDGDVSEVLRDAPEPQVSPLQVAHDALAAATTEDQLHAAWKLVNAANPSKSQEKELSAFYSERLDAIAGNG